ncbi:hypothetical protein PUV54_06060 [Hyphococcus flavus]|uniref:Tail specific protease domain-containing protein n=1 Tax=Hyphococcus flavus TaxID=1866326 RepID=A0AAE9ZLC5_9PROT|nr:hypothetical protein [Hyphococcus flavus]WDI32760.1 hypothetical protein PUV54_06060 [Hyphococcus flavus]
MRYKAFFAALMAFLANPANAATINEWRSSVDAIVNDILAIHPAPFAKTGETVWRREVAALRTDLPNLSEAERLARLMQLVAMIGDGHTQIEPTDSSYARWYPVRLYEFADGVFVTSAHNSVSDLAGAQVLEIAGRPVTEVLSRARSLRGADNEFDRLERLVVIHNAYLMKALGVANDEGAMEVMVRLQNGRTVRRILRPQSVDEELYSYYSNIFNWRYFSEVFGLPFGERSQWVSAYKNLPASAFIEADENRPPFMQRRFAFTKRAMPEKDAYYLYYGQTSYSGMVDFTREAFEEIDAQKPKRLILDIRHNFGGDGSTVGYMLREFVKRQNNPSWEELYLITGRKSFSAALFVIDAFKEHTAVTIVGEPAGASYVSYGDAVERPYPEIGVNLYVSTLTHLLTESNDLRPFIPVDVPAPVKFADYREGRDPAVDRIVSGEEMRSLPLIALMESGEAARQEHAKREREFSDISWRRPPAEIDFRTAIHQLREQKRLDDALALAKLNTEIHPYIWNTWYGLAEVLEEADDIEGQLKSYKCVILLDPNNYNAAGIRQIFADSEVDPEPVEGCPIKE